jgi:catechol 2,3-dioxygenase-like lactoylglutathione lyase family enzyme
VSLGPIRQVAYVVDDLDAALAYWIDVLGVGPFFRFDRIHLAKCVHRGVPTDPELSVALAQSGGVQIELIVQHDDEPSAYTDSIAAVGHGAHHLALWTAELDRHTAVFRARGLTELQSGSSSGDPSERFAYFAPPAAGGTILELVEVHAAKAEWYGFVADAARDWDGRDPVRPASRALGLN